MNVFTRCPNGDPGNGNAHDFSGYSPYDHADDKRPLMFCERCGEVRALALAPEEPLAVRVSSSIPSPVTTEEN